MLNYVYVCDSVCVSQCHMLGDKSIFFLEDHNMAMKLKQLGDLPSAGGELRIVVKPSSPPMQGRGSMCVCMCTCTCVCVCVCGHV